MPPGWNETATQWLSRSTEPSAKAIRDFLNRNLASFTYDHARGLVKKLTRGDWRSFFFEIVVGRYLQILGAQITPEPVGSNGTRVDFRATFPDGTVSVECVSKRYNIAAQDTISLHEKMARMLDSVGPTNWAIEFRRLPDANSPEQFQPYVDQAQEFYASLPQPAEDQAHVEFRCDGAAGPMELEAIPFPRGTKANHIGPVVSFFDNSILRLQSALTDEQKRKQAAGAVPPVILAIDGPFNGPDAEDVDQALFGQTVNHLDRNLQSTGVTFDPNGLLVTDKGIPFAGVWAFLKLTMVGGAEPILYLNPHQRWTLPNALASHETREWTSRIDRTPATRQPTIDKVGFVIVS
jgi:hypothetical protein